MKTSQQYADHDGVTCPACGASALSTNGNVQVTGGGASQSIECDHCGSTWEDTYKLVGYEFFEKGETDD
jgi:transposase-like protein